LQLPPANAINPGGYDTGRLGRDWANVQRSTFNVQLSRGRKRASLLKVERSPNVPISDSHFRLNQIETPAERIVRGLPFAVDRNRTAAKGKLRMTRYTKMPHHARPETRSGSRKTGQVQFKSIFSNEIRAQ
jgi:hypothetical protein